MMPVDERWEILEKEHRENADILADFPHLAGLLRDEIERLEPAAKYYLRTKKMAVATFVLYSPS